MIQKDVIFVILLFYKYITTILVNESRPWLLGNVLDGYGLEVCLGPFGFLIQQGYIFFPLGSEKGSSWKMSKAHL